MALPNLLLAYHGCSRALAERVVLRKDALRASTNDYDWLGSGLYFWENDPARARLWAEEKLAQAGAAESEPAVLGAVIEPGRCLNLTELESLRMVESAHVRLRELCETAGKPLPRNGGPEGKVRRLDAAVMDMLHLMREERGFAPFDTVRGFFVEGSPLYKGSGFRRLDHVQVCVRNPAQIRGLFFP